MTAFAAAQDDVIDFQAGLARILPVLKDESILPEGRFSVGAVYDRAKL
jgi:hypothetical protein